MPKHLFTFDNQPKNKGRKKIIITNPEQKVVQLTITTTQDVKDWYTEHRGLARKVVESFRKIMTDIDRQ